VFMVGLWGCFLRAGGLGLAPAGILFPHFLLLEKENGRDGRGELI